MEFGWINIFAAVMVIIMLIPNLLYSLKHRSIENKCKNRFMCALEQVGRYSCIVLMWLPAGILKFGFSSVLEMIVYFMANIILLLAYLVGWGVYYKKPSKGKALFLAIIPTIIFLVSGLLLRHWYLVMAAVVFGVGHVGGLYGKEQ